MVKASAGAIHIVYYSQYKLLLTILGEVVKELCSVEHDKTKNRFNDGKCDRLGRLWCGTLEQPSSVDFKSEGSFYSFDGGKQTLNYM